MGLRAQRQTLRQLVLAGAPTATLRLTAIAGGAILGVTGATLGVLLGELAAWGYWRLDHANAEIIIGDRNVFAPSIVGIWAVGVAGGVLAAWLPARSLMRAPLNEHSRVRGRGRARRWVGAGALCTGALACWAAVRAARTGVDLYPGERSLAAGQAGVLSTIALVIAGFGPFWPRPATAQGTLGGP